MFIDDTKKVCQYCGKEFNKGKKQRTAEHIFPKGLINLFPEQYIAFHNNKRFIDNKGVTIADVCGECNNQSLSSLDTYGNGLIKEKFLKPIDVQLKDEEYEVELDYYKLSRWLLKIIYNFRRSNNNKNNIEWFHKSLGFIMQDIRIENIDFSIFLGLHINTTPLPEEFYSYNPLQINEEPKLFGNSLAIASLGIDPYINSVKINKAFATYSIRFGAAVFYIILWDDDAKFKEKKYFNKLMTREFNFKQIISNEKMYNLKRVAAHSNTTMGYGHLISKSGIIEDDLFIQNSINGQSLSACQNYFYESKGEEGIKETRALVEMFEFPNNKRVRKNYEKYYGKD